VVLLSLTPGFSRVNRNEQLILKPFKRLDAADKVANLWGASPLPSIARFGRLAYPTCEKVTTRPVLGSKSHSCPERESASGRNDPGGKQTWRLEHKEMTAAPKLRSVRKSLYGFSPNCRPRNRCGKAAAQWEETGTGTTERAGVRVQASKKRFASDNVGKVPKTSSGWSKLQGLPSERKATAGERLWDWHMRS